MIRTTAHGPAKRRIAVIGIPRPQQARMGSIRGGYPAGPGVAFATINDAVPDSSANWLTVKLAEQAQARATTPGTLTYTPASSTPGANVAPWNSWMQPNCFDNSNAAAATSDPAADPATLSSPIALDSVNPLWLGFALLGAAASAVYLFKSAEGNRR